MKNLAKKNKKRLDMVFYVFLIFNRAFWGSAFFNAGVYLNRADRVISAMTFSPSGQKIKTP
jgi:hypothetical protein